MIVVGLFDLIACFIIFCICGVVLYHNIKIQMKQSRCPHDRGVNETQACDAICKLCHENLGFIGTEENKVRRSL